MRGIDSIASLALRVSIASHVIVASLLPIRRCRAKRPKAFAGDEERIEEAIADGIAKRRSCLIGA